MDRNVTGYRPTVLSTKEYPPQEGKTRGGQSPEARIDVQPRAMTHQAYTGSCGPGSGPVQTGDIVARPEGIVQGVPETDRQTRTCSHRNILDSPKDGGGMRGGTSTSTFPTQQPTVKVLLQATISSEIAVHEELPSCNTPGGAGLGSAKGAGGGRRGLVQVRWPWKRDSGRKTRMDNSRRHQH